MSKHPNLPLFFFFLLFLAYPLGWGKVLFGSVPYFGDVPLFDLNVLPFFAAALIFLRPGFLSGLWLKDGLSRWLLLTTGAGILLATVQQFRLSGPSDRFCVALFYLLLPLAGCAWAAAGDGSSRFSLPALPLLL